MFFDFCCTAVTEESTIVPMNSWPATIEEAASLREDLALKIRISPTGRSFRTVAAVDMAYCGNSAVAAAALYDLESLVCLEETVEIAEVHFPYIPGYLFFREGPVVVEALGKLSQRPDLLLIDGHGIAHPKKAGFASLLGALLDIPSIGCAKSRLVGRYEEPGPGKGDWSPLIYRKETVGAVVRSRNGTKPVFVSPGHLITLDEAVAIVLRCTPKFRVAEPLRKADALAGKTAKLLRQIDKPPFASDVQEL